MIATLALIVSTLLALLLILFVYVASFWVEVEKQIKQERDNLPPTIRFVTGVENEFGELSKNGKNPIRVIALARYINQDSSRFEKTKAFTSAYYSQVKHLVKKFRFVTAFIFWMEAGVHARAGLTLWDDISPKMKNQIDLEIFAAPSFMPASIPMLGIFFKKEALSFLYRAEQDKEINKALPPDNALIFSKIYALTKDKSYKEKVKTAGLARSHDADKLRRIYQHLKMKSIDELYKFCNI